mgnify:CR=1 FL=1
MLFTILQASRKPKKLRGKGQAAVIKRAIWGWRFRFTQIGGEGGHSPHISTGLVLSLGIFFLPALPGIFMLCYTKACQVCLIFFHPRDDKLYLEKKQIIGKICMQKTSKVYDQFMSTFSDLFRFGSIQCVKGTVVKCFASDRCATQMYGLKVI